MKEDFLDEDNEIPGQRFCLLSFLSPENVLDRKDLFFFESFLKNYEINWKSKNLEKFLAKQVVDFNKKIDDETTRLMEADLSGAADICRQSRIRIDGVLDAYQGFLKENASEITKTTIKNDYDDFMYSHAKRLEDEFHSKNNFQTSIRGLKLRGNYSTQEEATARAKKLQRSDPVHNIFVAQVGKWLAWDPKPHDIQEHEYAEDQLNDLMKAYKQNESDREEFYSKNPSAKTANKKDVVNMVEPGSDHGSLFDGADLALQRKMERDKSTKDE